MGFDFRCMRQKWFLFGRSYKQYLYISLTWSTMLVELWLSTQSWVWAGPGSDCCSPRRGD
jgi:hypothetical protein